MKLDITPLLRTEDGILHFKGESPAEVSWDALGEAIVWSKPVSLEGDASYMQGLCKLRGTLHLEYQASCARCLEPIDVTADIPFDEVFSAQADETAPDIYTFRGHILDLTDMTDDLVLLNMPMRHLCKEDCAGLCPVCGVNLNHNRCDCAVTAEPAPHPFAVLNKLQTQPNDEEV